MSDRPVDHERSRRFTLIALILIAVVLAIAVLVLWLRDCCGTGSVLAFDEAFGQVVLFQEPGVEGPDPFLSFDEHFELTGTPPPSSPEVGLYGGSLGNTCDKQLLIDFLLANPAKGQAWAAVQGIPYSSLASYISALTPTVLTQNTLVINHGFKNGTFTTLTSVLAAGTAVLVDSDGVPRARCFCGNPLTPPPPPPPDTCTVTENVAVIEDWLNPGSAQVGTVAPGDPIEVLGFAPSAAGLGAQVELSDSTKGWIPADALSDDCPCSVEETVEVLSSWEPGDGRVVGQVGPGDAITVLGEFALADYEGFGVLVELGDGTQGWIPADAVSASATFESSSDVFAKYPANVGPVASGSAVEWVITYDPDPLQVGATVVDTFGPGSTYVPGSAQGPAGWVVDDSVPGEVSWTFTGQDPATYEVSSAVQTPGPSVISTPSGKDGYQPIVFDHRLYFTHHHLSFGERSFNCFEVVTGDPCNGFPTDGSALPLPDGEPTTIGEGVAVGYTPEHVVVVDGRLLYPSTRLATSGAISDWGLGCIDLTVPVPTECGFTLLGTQVATPPQVLGALGVVEGPWLIDGRAFLLDLNLDLHCVVVTQHPFAPCGGPYPFDLSGVFGVSVPIQTGMGTGLRGAVDAARLYVGTETLIACVIPTSGGVTVCPGWGSLPGPANAPISAGAPFSAGFTVLRNTNLAATHICSEPAPTTCVDVATALPATVPALYATIDGGRSLGHGVHAGTRSYFPRFLTWPGDEVVCWDWATADFCTGFGQGGVISGPVNNGLLYGLGEQVHPGVDPNGLLTVDHLECVWAYGDFGRAWSFDPITGNPCGSSAVATAAGMLAPRPALACQTGGVGWVWDAFKATGVNPSEWESLQATLFDGGNVVATIDLLTASTTDLSYLGASPSSLTYSVVGTPKAGVTPAAVTVTLSYRSDGKPLEFCVSTVVEAVSCESIVTVLNGARAYPFGPDGEPVWESAVAGVKVYATLPESGCDACDDPPDETTPTTTAASTTLATTTSLATTTTGATTTTIAATTSSTMSTAPTATGTEYCVVDHTWDDALNVRSGAGTGNAVVGTLPFHGYGFYGTGATDTDDQGREWVEIDFGSGTGWVAGWLVVSAPCEMSVDFDVVLDLTAYTIDADPGEWDPPGQSPGCGEGGFCFFNGSITDRHVFPLDPAAEVFLIAPDVSSSGPFTLAQFADYLDGTWWDPAAFFFEPSLPYADPFGKATSGQPYALIIQNGKVSEIRQAYTP